MLPGSFHFSRQEDHRGILSKVGLALYILRQRGELPAITLDARGLTPDCMYH